MRPQQQGPVRFDLGREPPRISKEQRRLRERVTELQKKWESIRADLPPQLSRRHSTSHIRQMYDMFLTSSNSRNDFDWRSNWYR
jgi:hypothetical protein